MSDQTGHNSGVGRLLRPTPLIAASIALLIVVVAGVFAEWQHNQVARERLRTQVTSDVSLLRAKLEGEISGNIQLVRGLVSVIAAEPDIDQQRFANLTRSLFTAGSSLRSIAAAPDMTVTMVAPLAGNESVMGLNYRTQPEQSEAAMRVMRENRIIVAGPVDLVQGGRGFVARFPVTTNSGAFWGVVSAVIDADILYANAGLLDADSPLDLAILGRDGRGTEGQLFYGDSAVFDRDPVLATVDLPNGSWQIAGIPTTGWTQPSSEIWWIRAAVAIAGLLVVVPIVTTGHFLAQRQKTVRQLRQREVELATLSKRLTLALESSRVGVWELDLTTRQLIWDERMHELYGLVPTARSGSYEDWSSALHPDDRSRTEQELRQVTEDGGTLETEFRIQMKSGEVRHIRSLGSVVRSVGETPRVIGVNWDVTADVRRNEDLRRAKQLTEERNLELEAAKARIEHNALHDSLTGLPNRRYLDEMLRRRAQLETRRNPVALLHIDLDRFKQINDTLGHAAGDSLLCHAARVLTTSVAPGDFVARIGGDEFVIVCSVSHGEEKLVELAERIIALMRQPVPYQGHECRCGVSVGIAVERGDMDVRTLLVNADIALYRAKSSGRSRFEFFSDALQAELVRTKQMADEILVGLERQEFVAHYQPQFDAATHDVVGVEALARWDHPERGLQAPDTFLGIAEDLNVVANIDRHIMEVALRDLRAWNAAGVAVPRVSVNVSLRRLHEENLVPSLRQLHFKPGQLSFELVESIFLDDSQDMVGWNIDQLKELGVDIEIDDFGTGYASIVSLQKLRPKRLKIDRQLVDPIVSDKAQRKLLTSIIDIGKSLDIEVLAEGVETMQHARILRDLGCDILQGYAFARPMPEAELRKFLGAAPWRRAS
ncbi:bifunctional diguanylate cyclase/phosphodiesterase [Devosia pacifica]|uniref:Bifunctional diguanylate cyclase/phosphodiesterase n=1 Tax=Devosia pacifica TaxID=1335967 RepID=A0A918VT84_9HYPH|nr:EAL domain-containing protein [Devosia pacifica]GHA20689.1 bifunctional diguanylate cyclase/phosphodiesterase [Devosia pacifica]